jgi:hypothetical protein
MAKVITIEIDQATGDQTVDLNGYAGRGCDAVAQAFGNAVGNTEKIVHKGEFNKPAVHKNMLRQ